MKFVGVDLHKYSIVICVVNASRKVLERKRFSNLESDELRRYFAGLGEFELVVEATASYEWFVRLVEPVARRVILAHPGRLRVIAESTRKTDKVDARVLAEMLARDEIPQAYRPTPRQREHRRLVRERAYIQKRITAVKNRLRRILSDYNQDVKHLFTRAGRKHLLQAPLSVADRFVAKLLWNELKLHVRQRRLVDAELRAFSAAGSEKEQEDREIVRSVTGVGTVTTDVFLAEVADVSRFRSAKRLTAYAGLAPGQRESGGKRRDLHIEKTGSRLLRWVMVQAAWQLVRRSPGWQKKFQRLSARLKSKKAIVAIARQLICLLHSLLRQRVKYQESKAQPPVAA